MLFCFFGGGIAKYLLCLYNYFAILKKIGRDYLALQQKTSKKIAELQRIGKKIYVAYDKKTKLPLNPENLKKLSETINREQCDLFVSTFGLSRSQIGRITRLLSFEISDKIVIQKAESFNGILRFNLKIKKSHTAQN